MRARHLGSPREQVLAKPEYRKICEADNLIPAYQNPPEAGAPTAEFAKELGGSMRERGIVK